MALPSFIEPGSPCSRKLAMRESGQYPRLHCPNCRNMQWNDQTLLRAL
ncbi:hypothetical protein CaCOL14_005603 [Colletotrichum acutatum]